MKKAILVLVVCGLLFALTGCDKYPNRAADGAAWDRGWEMLGTLIGVEDQTNGFKLLANDVVLAGDDTYYANWVTGEPTKYTNEDGKEVDLYPAQIYLLLYGCADDAAAREAADGFIKRETDTYDVTETRAEAVNGQEYTVLIYNVKSETNPYERGAAAFAVRDNYVISAEISCIEGYNADEQQTLSDFLNTLHYADN